MNQNFNLFATAPKGLELLLVDELRALGAKDPREKLAGVTFSGDLKTAYKACLWSRLANRILLQLTQFPAMTPDELYKGIQTIAWHDHLKPTGTLAVHVVSNQSNITHTLFAAQKVKDAIVDQFREKFSTRPSVQVDKPDLSIYIYLHRDLATVSLDLSGESLHRRGYRSEQGSAPLKENLAAAILIRAGWPKIAKENGMLLDPMCGSGTLLIEAALMAGNIAPGLLREYFGFLGWRKHDEDLWKICLKEARNDCCEDKIPIIMGYDKDSSAINKAWHNIKLAEMSQKIHVEKKEFTEIELKKKSDLGLVVMNPPYGERMGEISELQKLYVDIGKKLKQDFVGWKAAVFTGNPDLAKKIGIRVPRSYALFNGALPCRLFLFDLKPENFIERNPNVNNERRVQRALAFLSEDNKQSVQMFTNRLQKKYRHAKKQAKARDSHCYTIYDADLPEYAVKIDYHDGYILVEEYPAPKSINKDKANERLQCIFAVLPDVLEVPAAKIFFAEDKVDFEEVHIKEKCEIE